MRTYQARLHGLEPSETTVDLTDEEYQAVLKFIRAVNADWSASSTEVTSIDIEAVSPTDAKTRESL